METHKSHLTLQNVSGDYACKETNKISNSYGVGGTLAVMQFCIGVAPRPKILVKRKVHDDITERCLPSLGPECHLRALETRTAHVCSVNSVEGGSIMIIRQNT